MSSISWPTYIELPDGWKIKEFWAWLRGLDEHYRKGSAAWAILGIVKTAPNPIAASYDVDSLIDVYDDEGNVYYKAYRDFYMRWLKVRYAD